MNNKLITVSNIGAFGAITVAIMGLIGYLPGMELLGRINENYIPMPPSTAISFIVLGYILLVFNIKQPTGVKVIIPQILTLLVSLFGILEVAGHFSGIDLNLEDTIVPAAGNLNGIPIARMSPSTGAVFFLAGFAVLALLIPERMPGKTRSLGHSTGVLGSAILICSLVFAGAYLLDSPLLYGHGTTVPMALTTALAFVMFGVALIGSAGNSAFPALLLRTSLPDDGKPISTRKRIILLVFIMVGVCTMTMVIMTFMLYRNNIEEHRMYLKTIAQSQARLIEALASYDSRMENVIQSKFPDHDAAASSLSQIIDTYEKYEGFSETGEFTLARHEGNNIVFVMRHRSDVFEYPQPVPFDSELAEPMRLALEGRSGTVIGFDYRGEKVLAAYEPVAILNLGIVVKIDVSEIRVPFIRSVLIGAIIAGALVLFGIFVFYRVSDPVIKILEKHTKNLENEIEHRRRTEEALRQSAYMVSNSTDMMALIDKKYVYLTANEAYLEMFGLTPDELIGHTVSEIFGEEFLKTVIRPNAVRCLAGEKVNFQEWFEFPSWGKAYMDINYYPYIDKNKEIIGFVVNGRDVTEGKLINDALHQSEARFRSVVETAGDSIISIDSKGKIIFTNNETERMFGYSSDELSGKLVTDLMPEQFRKAHRKGVERVSSGGDTRVIGITTELIGLKNDGGEFPIDLSLSMWMHDESIYFTGIIRDITKRNHLEEQFRQSQKMEAIGRLAGGVAHDFNNLLTVITGHAELAKENLDPRTPLRDSLQEIQNAGDKAAELTRQLLAFSRKQTLQPRVLDLNTIITGLDKMLRRVIGEDIDLETISGEDLRNVEADPGQIDQVIINLAVNARDAMPEGGKLTIETMNVELDEEYASNHPEVTPGPHVMLAVSDTGCGMTDEIKTQVFEPFFTTKEKGKGTGLGLSTVYGIVKQSGGSIWLYSEVGKGTTFKIYLPMVAGTTDELKHDDDLIELPHGTETILLVEDEDGVRKLACQVLEQQGYKIIEAENGLEALRICKEMEKQVDLVVTDVVMPKMGGAVLVQKLNETWTDLKVLYMSGYTDNAIAHSGVLDSDKPYLQKPFRPIDLARKVREILDS